MRGGFYLYGNYYQNANDALAAEMSQCNEIDNRINSNKIKELEHTLYEREPKLDLRDIWRYIKILEQRIVQLEKQEVKEEQRNVNKNDINEFDFEGEDEETLLPDCPKCGRSYTEIDYEYQSCSKCGWDADKEEFNQELVREPDDIDFMNGDADLMTGQWI